MLFKFSLEETIVLFVLFSLCVAIHEFSHVFVLYCFGDHSETIKSRLTLSPGAHMTIWGTLIFFLTGLLIGKPVMFEEENINERHNKHLVLIITKLAGPISNLAAAILGLLIRSYFQHYPGKMDLGYSGVIEMLEVFSLANVYFFCFNILPIPFLDGGIFIQLIAEEVLNIGTISLIGGVVAFLALMINSYMGLGINWLDFLVSGYPDKVFSLLQSII